jgi:hypothetical protein
VQQLQGAHIKQWQGYDLNGQEIEYWFPALAKVFLSAAFSQVLRPIQPLIWWVRMVNSSGRPSDLSLPSFAWSMLYVHPPLPTHLHGVVFTDRRHTSNCTFVFTCYCVCKWNLTERIKLVRFSPLLEMLSALGSLTDKMAVGCNRRQIWLCGMPRTCSGGSLKSRLCGVATGRIPTDEMVNFKLWVEKKWRYPDALPDPPGFEVWRAEGEGDSQRVKQKQ